MNGWQITWALLRDGVWAGVAALGFAVLFQVPRRTLLGCVVGGALGHAIRTGLLSAEASIELATLAGAIGVGFWGVWCARYWQAPTSLFTVCGVIPLVPGTYAYRTMIGVLQVATESTTTTADVLVQASVNAIKTALILGAISAGIALPALLFRRIKPVV